MNKDILRVASNENVGLIHALTMQNHSPYSGEIPEMAYTARKLTPMCFSGTEPRRVIQLFTRIKSNRRRS